MLSRQLRQAAHRPDGHSLLNRVSYPQWMSQPEGRDRPDGGGVVEGADNDSAAESGAGDNDVPTSDTGVGLSVGEPNTFEPEEAGPAAGSPTE